MYQFSSNAGSLQEYVHWLQNNGYWFGDELAKYELTGSEFDAAWEWLANSQNRNDFEQSQYEYAKAAYYDRSIEILAENYYHIDNHAEIMKDVVWSRAIQYGPGNILDMFTEAVKSLGYPNLSYVDSEDFDADMIKAIYLTVCSSWEWNHSELRDNLNDRYQYECDEALSQL